MQPSRTSGRKTALTGTYTTQYIFFRLKKIMSDDARFYPLPCMLTMSSLFSGFYSIVASINGTYYAAAIAILVAAVFDGLDGRVARMTNSTSRFGMELDSLCDAVSFGVAPALLVYLWALSPYGRYGWLAAFLYVATTTLRLARYNVQEPAKAGDFTGLPCPMAAGMIVTTVLFCHFLGATGTVRHLSILLLVYVLSYLMVSTHRYRSFKKSSGSVRQFQLLVFMVLLLILVATEPPVTLFILFLIYTVSGPVEGLVLRAYARMGRKSQLKEG
jgi:CDP-diacylglycerol--serine O-phosphatidyltransferase